MFLYLELFFFMLCFFHITGTKVTLRITCLYKNRNGIVC